MDLHFHDLRHHALSILFEQGYSIQEVAIVSGHSSWDMLKRYTHIKPESLHRSVTARVINLAAATDDELMSAASSPRRITFSRVSARKPVSAASPWICSALRFIRFLASHKHVRDQSLYAFSLLLKADSCHLQAFGIFNHHPVQGGDCLGSDFPGNGKVQRVSRT